MWVHEGKVSPSHEVAFRAMLFRNPSVDARMTRCDFPGRFNENHRFSTCEKPMKVHYDDAVDALYIELSEETPDGAIELSDGINVDTTAEGRIAGIEILNASSRMDLTTILSYSLDVDKSVSALNAQ